VGRRVSARATPPADPRGRSDRSRAGDHGRLRGPDLALSHRSLGRRCGLATEAGERCRLDAAETVRVRRAALVHDLGRAAIGARTKRLPTRISPTAAGSSYADPAVNDNSDHSTRPAAPIRCSGKSAAGPASDQQPDHEPTTASCPTARPSFDGAVSSPGSACSTYARSPPGGCVGWRTTTARKAVPVAAGSRARIAAGGFIRDSRSRLRQTVSLSAACGRTVRVVSILQEAPYAPLR
jgi:hypothetical protein